VQLSLLPSEGWWRHEKGSHRNEQLKILGKWRKRRRKGRWLKEDDSEFDELWNAIGGRLNGKRHVELEMIGKFDAFYRLIRVLAGFDENCDVVWGFESIEDGNRLGGSLRLPIAVFKSPRFSSNFRWTWWSFRSICHCFHSKMLMILNPPANLHQSLTISSQKLVTFDLNSLILFSILHYPPSTSINSFTSFANFQHDLQLPGHPSSPSFPSLSLPSLDNEKLQPIDHLITKKSPRNLLASNTFELHKKETLEHKKNRKGANESRAALLD
jgi:hypothetical protein